MNDDAVSLKEAGPFVPFPTALLDEWMPHLKDTEWRLLCVVVRQTLGWKNGRGRKARDWMTQTQLMKRTGRNSAALSSALDSLVSQGLIECSTYAGSSLISSQQRKRHRGRTYFRLAPHLLIAPEQPAQQLLNSTVPTPNSWARAGDISSHLAQQRQKTLASKCEVQKAKWTKETQEQKKSR